jgi:hypothetical protein
MAGKAKRKAARDRRRSKKKARKADQKKQYEQWKLQGINTKSKRVRLRKAHSNKYHKVRLQRHRKGPCTNIGCRDCNPMPYNLVTPTQKHLAA